MKKKLIYATAAFIIAASVQKTNAQWATVPGSTNDIHNTNTGNVGIGTGTAIPGYKLDILGGTAGAAMRIKSTGNNASVIIDRPSTAYTAQFYFRTNNSNKWTVGMANNGTNNYSILNGTASKGAALTVLNSNNYIGIGTSEPTSKLNVLGSSGPGDTLPVIDALVKYSGIVDVIAVNAVSQPSAGYGIGVSALGNYLGVDAAGSVVGVNGFSPGGTGTAGFSQGSGTASGVSVGVDGEADQGQLAVGVYGYAANGGNSFAIYGDQDDTLNATVWAGFFTGDVGAVHFYLTSDAKLKQNIRPLADATSKLMQLHPSNYEFKRGEFKQLCLPAGKQIGLIADEVEKVYPELIKQTTTLPRYKRVGKERIMVAEPLTYKSVDYIGLIPVLIQNAQEQKVALDKKDEQISQQESRISSLESELAQIKNMMQNGNSGSLKTTPVSDKSTYARMTCEPNPFHSQFNIRYSIPENISNAYLTITNAEGKVLEVKNIDTKGDGQYTFHTPDVSTGAYTVSLFADGKVVETKNMILTK